MIDNAWRAAEDVARQSYGKLIATLTAQTRDISAAEDALSEAFTLALSNWSEKGVPDAPEAWLLTTARRKLIDRARSAALRADKSDTVSLLIEERAMLEQFDDVTLDKRLELLFVCTHPSIDRDLHTPLMLQSVMGLTADQISGAFLAKPTAMAQRLVRAKRKIKDAGIPFELPPEDHRAERMSAVLDAVYAAYNAGWEDIHNGNNLSTGLAREAEWLARLLIRLAPNASEVKGLLALILYAESRRAARRNSDGGFVPLSDQDTTLWDHALIEEADDLLTSVTKESTPGRYQLEAVIQGIHAARRWRGDTDWPLIASAYRRLLQIAPSWGAQVAYAAALGKVDGPLQGLYTLDALPADRMESYAPYWATRAHLLKATGQKSEAYEAYAKAWELIDDDAAREWLKKQSLDS